MRPRPNTRTPCWTRTSPRGTTRPRCTRLAPWGPGRPTVFPSTRQILVPCPDSPPVCWVIRVWPQPLRPAWAPVRPVSLLTATPYLTISSRTTREDIQATQKKTAQVSLNYFCEKNALWSESEQNLLTSLIRQNASWVFIKRQYLTFSELEWDRWQMTNREKKCALIFMMIIFFAEKNKETHIKKPLNAFMLYMKEMRPVVQAECTLKESAAINQILGRRVRKENILSPPLFGKFVKWQQTLFCGAEKKVFR